jgi:glutaredoxin
MFVRVLQRWLSRPAACQEPVELRLYTRADCPLCDTMKAELARARVRPPFRLVEIDVERDPELLARHGTSIPVLEIGGRPAFKGRLTAAEFERKYARRVVELRGGARHA